MAKLNSPTLVLLILLSTGLVGCDPTVFGDLEDEASTRVLEKPDSYPKINYGNVVAGFAGMDLSGTLVSRVSASGGTDTPFLVYNGWTGENVDLGAALFEGCNDPTACPAGTGTAIVGIPSWKRGQSGEGRLCALVTAAADGALIVRCEIVGGLGNFVNEQYVVAPSIGFGESGAAISGNTPVGVAVFGAPLANGNAGALYRVPDGGGPVAIDIPAAALGTNGRLGSSVATFTGPGGGVLLAAGAPTMGRVVVLSLMVDGGGTLTTTVRACIENSAVGYGSAVALGDTDDDGMPELFVRSPPSGGTAAVEVFPGNMLPAATGACTDWPGKTQLTCPASDVTCMGDFGAALAVGDINGDGVSDLLVGDPSATVEGISGAGALFALQGPALTVASSMVLSSPAEGDSLGHSVALMPSHLDTTGRMEPVAGAPGRNTVNVFLCSGLPGDTPEVGARCIVGR